MLAFQLSWQVLAPLPKGRAALLHAVVRGRLLVAGERSGRIAKKLWSRRCDFFDPQTNIWSPRPALAHASRRLRCGRSRRRYVLLGGTSDDRVLDDVIAFDGTSWQSRPKMLLPAQRKLRAWAATAFRNWILLLGGYTVRGSSTELFTTVADDEARWNATSWSRRRAVPSDWGKSVRHGRRVRHEGSLGQHVGS
jgi:hypothetical protein